MTVIGAMLRLYRIRLAIYGMVNAVRWRLYRLFDRRRKLNFGCGPKPLADYINLDASYISGANFIVDCAHIGFLESGHYEEIRMDAFFEHLYRYQQRAFLSHAFRSLKPGGALIINRLPDFEACMKLWEDGAPGLFSSTFDLFELYRQTHGDPQPYNAICQMHKDLFTRKSIADLLESQGFIIERMVNDVCTEEPIPINLFITARKPISPA